MKKNLVEKKLEILFVKTFKVNKKQLSQLSIGNFYKWDSLSHIKLIMEIEKKFQISINNNVSVNLTSYRKIHDYLTKSFIKK